MHQGLFTDLDDPTLWEQTACDLTPYPPREDDSTESEVSVKNSNSEGVLLLEE